MRYQSHGHVVFGWNTYKKREFESLQASWIEELCKKKIQWVKETFMIMSSRFTKPGMLALTVSCSSQKFQMRWRFVGFNFWSSLSLSRTQFLHLSLSYSSSISLHDFSLYSLSLSVLYDSSLSPFALPLSLWLSTSIVLYIPLSCNFSVSSSHSHTETITLSPSPSFFYLCISHSLPLSLCDSFLVLSISNSLSPRLSTWPISCLSLYLSLFFPLSLSLSRIIVLNWHHPNPNPDPYWGWSIQRQWSCSTLHPLAQGQIPWDREYLSSNFSSQI